MAENKKVIISIVVDDKSAKKNLKDIGNETEKLGNKTNKANKGFLKLGKTFGAIARGFVIVKSFQLLAKAILEVAKVGAEFELQMAKVKAITGASNKEFKQLEGAARDLALGTQFTATQVGELQLAYSKLGFTTDEILDATEATLNLATATGEDLAGAADVLGATIRGFGLDASEAGRVADVMGSAFSSSALNLETFKQSMKTIAPIARAANVDLETSSALLSVLADAGLRGTKAATGLKNIMSDLTDPTSDLARELGYTVKNSEGLKIAFRDLADRNIDLSKATEISDERSKAALITIGRSIDKVNDLTEAYKGSRGAIEEQAKIIEDTLVGDYKKLQSAIDEAFLDNTNGINIILRKSTQLATEFFNLFSERAEILERYNELLDLTGIDIDTAPITKLEYELYLAQKRLEEIFKIQRRDLKENLGITDSKELDRLAKENIEYKAQEKLLKRIKKEITLIKEEGQDVGERIALLEKDIEKEEKAIKKWQKLAKGTERYADNISDARYFIEENKKAIKALLPFLKKVEKAAPLGGTEDGEKSIKNLNDEILQRVALRKKEADATKGSWKDIERARLQARKDNIEDLRGLQQTEKQSKEEFSLWQKNLQQKEANEANQITKKGLEKRQEIVDHNNDELKKGEKALNDEIKELQEERNQLIQEAFNVGFDLLNVQLENRLNALERANEEELRGFEKLQNDKAARFDIEMQHQLDSFVGTEQQKADFEKQKRLEQLEFEQQQAREREALRKKQIDEENRAGKAIFRANKLNSLANIAMNTAQAVMGVNANPTVNADVTQTLRTLLTNLVLGIGAAQGAVVASQRFQPKTYQDGGMIQGESHANGGVPFTVAGQAGFEAEGGEYIFSRKTVNRLGVDFLDSLNFGQRQFANGGFVAGKDFARIQAESRYAFTGQMAGVQIAELARVTEEKFTELSSIVANIRVTNVATDTAEVSSNVLNAQAMATL